MRAFVACKYILMTWVLLYLIIFCFKQKTAYEMRISDWSSDVGSSDLGGYEAAEPNGKPCRSQRIAIVAGDPIRSQSESDERACDDNGTQSRQSDATQCPVSRHQSMQSSKPLIRLLALWLGRRSFPTQSDR